MSKSVHQDVNGFAVHSFQIVFVSWYVLNVTD